MKILFEESFEKDLKKIKSSSVKKRLKSLLSHIEEIQTIHKIPHLKKLKGTDSYYRIRLSDYRIGVEIQADTIIFVRILHRKDIYRYFP
jgi:mRNA interferase RelE/StbE